MNLTSIDYNLERTKDCILINVNNWVQPKSNILQIHKIKGTSHNTKITKVLKASVNNEKYNTTIKEEDIVLLANLVTDIAMYRSYSFDDNEKYYDVPIMQVIGVFQDNIVSFENLTPITDKVIMEKIDTLTSDVLISKSRTTIGRVLKVGSTKFDNIGNKLPLQVKIGDLVLVRDNVATEFTLDGKDYIAVEENSIIGIFNNDNISLGNLEVINEWVLLQPYIKEKISETLYTPSIDYEDLDWTDLFNRDLFRIVKSDKSLTKVKENDIILIDRNVTTYAYLGLEKFFITRGVNYIEGIVREEEI